MPRAPRKPAELDTQPISPPIGPVEAPAPVQAVVGAPPPPNAPSTGDTNDDGAIEGTPRDGYVLAQVTPTVRIARAPQNIILQTLRTVATGPRKGTQVWENAAYYGSLRSAAIGLFNSHFDLVVDFPVELRDFVPTIERCAKLIADACEKAAP